MSFKKTKQKWMKVLTAPKQYSFLHSPASEIGLQFFWQLTVSIAQNQMWTAIVSSLKFSLCSTDKWHNGPKVL